MEGRRLHPEHAGILTAIFQQFRVAALFDDSAIIDHGDAVRASHRGEAVRNDDRGQTRGQLEEAIKQLDFGAYIQVRGGFIQHRYVRTGFDSKQRTGKRDSLPLSAAKVHAAGESARERGVEASRYRLDQVQ